MLLVCNSMLELRSFHIEMADDLFALVEKNREHLQKWLTWVPHNKSPSDSLSFFRDGPKSVEQDQAFRGGIFGKEILIGTLDFMI